MPGQERDTGHKENAKDVVQKNEPDLEDVVCVLLCRGKLFEFFIVHAFEISFVSSSSSLASMSISRANRTRQAAWER